MTMGVEDKYPGFTYHTYKENHPVHQFNSGKTNSHVRINGTVYIDTGEGPVPIEFDDYDKLNNDTFQNSMEPGLPNPFYLKDLDYDGEYPPTSNEYKAASKLLALVSEKGTMPCTWSLGGADGERIVFVEPTRVGSNKIKFNLGGYVYTMEVLADKVITTTKLIDEGSDDYDKLTNDIFQEFAESAGIPTPLGLKSFDFTNKHPDYSYEYKFASALKTKLENGEDLKCTWSVSGDDDESVIFVTPTLTDGCIKFTLGGNLYSMEFTNDNKVDCTTTPINEYKDYDVYSDEMFQEFAKTCGFTSDIQLKDLDFNNSYVPASKEYKLADTLMTILDGNLTAKCTWFISDEEYIFIEPTKYDDNIVAFTVGGTLYKFTKNSDGSKIIFSNEPINKASDDYDVFVDQEFKTLINTVGVTLPHGLIDLNFNTTANVFSDEYKVADLIIDILKAGDPVRCTWSVKLPDNKEYIFVDPTLYDDNTIHFVYGGNLYEMVTNPTTGVVTKTYPIRDSVRHESDYWMEAYEEITSSIIMPAPQLKQFCQNDGTYYNAGTTQYDVLRALYDETLVNGNLKALYENTVLSDGSIERIMCDVAGNENNVLYINNGVEIIRAQFIDDSGDEYLLLNRYNIGEADTLYNNWFQKWYMEIYSDNYDDQFFILSMNSNKPKHYGTYTPEYEHVAKLFQGITYNDKTPVHVPIGLSPEFEGQQRVIFADLVAYSGIYGNNVVTEVDFDLGRWNYRLIYSMGSAGTDTDFVCLDKHNKYADIDEDIYNFVAHVQPYTGFFPIGHISYANIGESPEPLNPVNSEIDIANRLMTYYVGDYGYNVGNTFKYPYNNTSYYTDFTSADPKYQINTTYEIVDVIADSIPVDDVIEHNLTRFCWTLSNHAYFLEHDPQTDTWVKYTHILMNHAGETLLYDSNAHTNSFHTIIGRTDILMNDICRLPNNYGTEIDKLIAALKAMSTSAYKRVLTVPYSLSNTTLAVQRYDLCELTLTEGYTSTTGDHPGLVISNPKGEIQVIDYFEYNSTPKYYITKYSDLSIRTAIWYHTGDSMGSSTISRLYNYDIYNTSELENIVFPFLGYDCISDQNSVGQSKILRVDSTSSKNKSAFNRMQQIVYGLGKQFVLGNDCIYAWRMEHNSTGGIVPCRVNTYGTGYNPSTLSSRCEHTAFIVTAPEGQYVIKMYDSSWNTVSCIDTNMAIITITNVTGLNVTDIDDMMAYIRNCYITGATQTPYSYEDPYLAYNVQLAPLSYMQYGASSSSKQVYSETSEQAKRIEALRKCAEYHATIFGHASGQNNGMLFKAVWDFGRGNHNTSNITKIQLTDVKCLDVGSYNRFQMCIAGDKYHIQKNGTNWELWID